LTSIVIPDSVEEIGANAFAGCTNLKDVTLGKNVRWLGRNAFEDCTSLESIIIPANVTGLEMWVFRNCRNLTSVIFKASTPPRFSGRTFDGCHVSLTIFVPIGAMAAYRAVRDLEGQGPFMGLMIIEIEMEEDPEETPEECPDCKADPCECEEKPDVCEVCEKETCECIDAPDLCIECKKEICVCCTDCKKYPCECVVLCGLCGEDPCVCVAINVIGDATVTITLNMMITVGSNTFLLDDPEKLTLTVSKVAAPENTEKFFDALKKFLTK
jgi:hypothetical protein